MALLRGLWLAFFFSVALLPYHNTFAKSEIKTPLEYLFDDDDWKNTGWWFDLLDYMSTHVDPIPRDVLESQIEHYNRMKHFGGWVNPQNDCRNTRALILERDSSVAVDYRPPNNCVVANGSWHDHYTERDFTDAQDLQIDHVVPLKNAYLSGAYQWDRIRRCVYGNFMANNYHLLPVYGPANQAKSDSGPEKYIPPNKNFTCQYVRIWMMIKAIWELTVSTNELNAVKRILNSCSSETSLVNQSELADQRTETYNVINNCH